VEGHAVNDTSFQLVDRNGRRDSSWNEIFFRDEIFFTSKYRKNERGRTTSDESLEFFVHAHVNFFVRKCVSHSRVGIFSSPKRKIYIRNTEYPLFDFILTARV